MKGFHLFYMACLIGITIDAQISLNDVPKLIQIGKDGWEIFNAYFFPADVSQPKQPTAILMRYNYITSRGKAKSRAKYIQFENKVDNPVGDGPFENLQNTAQKLSKKKKADMDVSEECELVYYEDKKKKRMPINIMDDGDLIILMAKDGDQDDNTRLIDIICEEDDEIISEQSGPIQAALYAKNQKAFNHVIAIQNDNTNMETQTAASALNQAGFGGFSIDAKGIAILDIEKAAFKSRTDELAKEWEWDGKIKSTLNIVTVAGKQFSGGLNVEFDAANWQIKGSYSRFAGFKTVEGKYSIYVATAKFDYTIPRAEREGSTLDHLGITAGGSIKGDYFEKIKILMEGKALERFNIDVVKPDKDDYKIYRKEL